MGLTIQPEILDHEKYELDWPCRYSAGKARLVAAPTSWSSTPTAITGSDVKIKL